MKCVEVSRHGGDRGYEAQLGEGARAAVVLLVRSFCERLLEGTLGAERLQSSQSNQRESEEIGQN